MSDDDYLVPKRKNKEIRAEALSAKKFYGTEKRRPVNIIRCLKSGKILTRRGRKNLIYKIVDDELMGNRDGKTSSQQIWLLSPSNGASIKRRFGAMVVLG